MGNRIQQGDLAYYHFSDKQMKWLEKELKGTIHFIEQRLAVDGEKDEEGLEKELETSISIYNLLFGGIEYNAG